MESTGHQGPDVRRIERLAAEMALTFNWISLYQEGHPSLAGRVEMFHRNLAEILNEEPSGHLLLGVAKDKILYQNVFLGQENSLVRGFITDLFQHQVATLDFSREATPRDLLTFFLSLRRIRVEKNGGKLDEILKKEGVRGIGLYPYNYKEVLSRRILQPGGEAASSNREDELWRMILTENVSVGDGGGELPGDLPIPPELMPAILRRINVNAAARGNRGDAGPDSGPETISPETTRRILSRLGDTLRKLSVEQRSAVIRSLDVGVGDAAAADDDGGIANADIVRSLTEADSDDGFLDLLATLLVAEEKSGNRIRRIFEVIATERNGDGSLLPAVKERVRESVRTKNYYAQKAWEAIEGLLLQRTEAAYIGQDHSNLLEKLSNLDATAHAADGSTQADPAVTSEFGEENLHLKGVGVLLELLEVEEAEEEFLELLEEVRKVIPNLISRRELPLLKTLLSTLTEVHRNAPDSRKPAIERVVGEVDFAHMIDLYLSPPVSKLEKGRIEEILVAFVGESIGDFLDRLLMETDQGNRKTLLSLAFRFDAEAVPAIRGKLDEPHWYFVRNLFLILGRIGDPSVVPDLVRGLDHPDLRVRKEAILALGRIRGPESVPFLGKVLLHETLLQSAREESLRIDAANAIFRCGGTRAVALLHRGTESRRAKVREHCTTLLGTLRGKK
jgi:hypothetical protein